MSPTGTASILAFALVACTPAALERTYLTEDKVSGKASPASGEYGGQDFFVLEVGQLAELRRAESLTYLGSDARFHYLRVWSKLGHPDEIQLVALLKEACTVVDEQPIDADEPKLELKYDPSRRPAHTAVKVAGNACVVPVAPQ
jgi:hypothetical protein